LSTRWQRFTIRQTFLLAFDRRWRTEAEWRTVFTFPFLDRLKHSQLLAARLQLAGLILAAAAAAVVAATKWRCSTNVRLAVRRNGCSDLPRRPACVVSLPGGTP